MTDSLPTSGVAPFSWIWLISTSGGPFAASTRCAVNSGGDAQGGTGVTCSIAPGSLTGGNTYAFELEVSDATPAAVATDATGSE
ncbi:MAG: hypothetical protein KGI89_17265, partial [Euryarchaeota archaeon]|nr:hypothetical protein [Euryarchaeota archaeon]